MDFALILFSALVLTGAVALWDRLFGTATKHLSMQELGNKPLGLPQGRARTLSPIQLILEPIKSDNLNLSNKTLT